MHSEGAHGLCRLLSDQIRKFELQPVLRNGCILIYFVTVTGSKHLCLVTYQINLDSNRMVFRLEHKHYSEFLPIETVWESEG